MTGATDLERLSAVAKLVLYRGGTVAHEQGRMVVTVGGAEYSALFSGDGRFRRGEDAAGRQFRGRAQWAIALLARAVTEPWVCPDLEEPAAAGGEASCQTT